MARRPASCVGEGMRTRALILGLGACGSQPSPMPSPGAAPSAAAKAPTMAATAAPIHACGADRICRRRPRLELVRDEVRVGYGTVRPVAIERPGLWQLDGLAWQRRPLGRREFTVDVERARPLTELVGEPLGAGNYFVTYLANGLLECQALAVGAMCNDLMTEVAPGEVAMCVAGRGALAVPDPARLVPGCEQSGYVHLDEPARGDGQAQMRLEDGRVAAEWDVRGGRPHGKRVTHMLPSGTPHHVEAMLVDGKEHGPMRYFDPDGRVRTEILYAAGRRHGLARTFGPAGELLEEWTWRDGLLHEVRVWDAAGREVAREHYPEGRASGTFCRPDRHCSQY